MKTEKRWQLIEEFLHKSGTLSVQELAEKLSVSETTIRRDLIKMENNNMVNRLWGGACLATEKADVAVQYQDEYIFRFGRNIEAKKRIARCAAERVHDGSCIFLDAGSTVSYIPQYITAADVTVVTNSLNIFQILAEKRIQTYLPHGLVNFACAAIMGPDTTDWIAEKNFDLVFLGNGGLDPTLGFTTRDETDAKIKRCALARCQEGGAYILSDRTKNGVRKFHTFAGLNDACLITDEQPEFPVEHVLIAAE